MSQDNYIRNLLNIKDPNITFDENGVSGLQKKEKEA